MQLKFSTQIFTKKSNTILHENLSSLSQVVLCVRTDIHDKANGCFFAILAMHLTENIIQNYITNEILYLNVTL